jgi:N-acetylglucosaminyl-diphospho-decaprenol L-rhamnosyltransferase
MPTRPEPFRPGADADRHAPRVAMGVVIINYRTADMTIDCLGTLAEEARGLPGGCRVIVVDNLSGDDSPGRIDAAIATRGWADFARLVRSPVNGGFSAGNNVGIRAVDAESYLLLNSDTLVEPGALQKLLDHLRAHAGAGLVGPRLQWPDGVPQQSCFRWHTPLTELVLAAATGPVSRLLHRHEPAMPVSETSMTCQWTSFACVLIRREVIERLGPMDEGYFMYFEDVDYCRRAVAAGYAVRHEPAARVVHLRGGSSPVKSLQAQRKRRPAYFYASRSRYYARFYGRTGLWLANALWSVGRFVALIREAVGHKQPHVCQLEARDIWTSALRPLSPPSARGGVA